MIGSVAVPAYLLDDIFRLVEYLGDLSDYDDLHVHKAGYTPQFEHDTALWELKLKIKRLQSEIVDTYLLTVDGVTDLELDALEEWVFFKGKSVYDNPYSVYDESGQLMDFINGCRTGFEMAEDFLRFHVSGLDDIDVGDQDEVLPF